MIYMRLGKRMRLGKLFIRPPLLRLRLILRPYLHRVQLDFNQ